MAKPWLKITFDATRPGVALVSNFPRKGRSEARGQWVVFDKNDGDYGLGRGGHTRTLFMSGSIDDCHAFIEGEVLI